MVESGHHIDAVCLPGNRTIGPYSDAVKAGEFVFLSGRVGLDYSTMQLVEGGIGAQTRQCLTNIIEVLTLSGVSLNDVVKTTVYLIDMADFKAMNAAYAEIFAEKQPARSTIAVAGLPMAALVEIEVMARRRC